MRTVFALVGTFVVGWWSGVLTLALLIAQKKDIPK